MGQFMQVLVNAVIGNLKCWDWTCPVIRLHIQVTPRFQGRNRAAKGEGVRPIGKVGDSKLAYND
jgi:hypothetical protein